MTYLGDASVGAGANIGAGTITCNYDGFTKSTTEIGPGAFIGSNSALVAPVTVGEGAIVGAGSVITKNVPADAVAIARGSQSNIDGAAERFRARKATSMGQDAALEGLNTEQREAVAQIDGPLLILAGLTQKDARPHAACRSHDQSRG